MFHRKLSALAAVALVASTPAFASNEESRSVVVTTAGLDLSTEDGVARLERRVRNAAANACDMAHIYGSRERVSALRCYEDAIASSRDAVTRLAGRKADATKLALRIER